MLHSIRINFSWLVSLLNVSEGIGVACGGAADCTNAPLTPLGQAVQTALKSMMADGSYAKILDKYGAKGSAVTLP